jgi:hypothetical protein
MTGNIFVKYIMPTRLMIHRKGIPPIDIIVYVVGIELYGLKDRRVSEVLFSY